MIVDLSTPGSPPHILRHFDYEIPQRRLAREGHAELVPGFSEASQTNCPPDPILSKPGAEKTDTNATADKAAIKANPNQPPTQPTVAKKPDVLGARPASEPAAGAAQKTVPKPSGPVLPLGAPRPKPPVTPPPQKESAPPQAAPSQ